ncbi:MFS transporter, partial [Pseudomonas poae]
PLSRRARFTALFTMSIPIAGMIGGPLSGWLIHAFEGVGGMRGWQWLFIVEGLPACFIGIFAYFYLQNSPAASSWLSTDEK